MDSCQNMPKLMSINDVDSFINDSLKLPIWSNDTYIHFNTDHVHGAVVFSDRDLTSELGWKVHRTLAVVTFGYPSEPLWVLKGYLKFKVYL